MANKVVFKIPLELVEEQVIVVQEGGEILYAAEQDGGIAIWYSCDQNQQMLPRTIYISGTGQPISFDAGHYIKTVLLDGGASEWHVFEGYPVE